MSGCVSVRVLCASLWTAGSTWTAQAQALPLWELGMGVGALSLPHYRGSDQSHTWLLPVPYVVYRGTIFKADREGARAVLFDSDRVELNMSLAASAPTRSRDNLARAGMPDLSPTVELGPNLNLVLARSSGWQLDLRLPVRAAMTVSSSPAFIGWTSNPHLNLDRRWGGWNLGLQSGPVWGGSRYHSYFYGVNSEDAQPHRPAYRASGGYAGLQAIAALSHRSGGQWLGMFVKFDSLRGAAFDGSPLVRQRQQWSAGMAMSWVFSRSSHSAPQAPATP